jgi:hypothetical protein
MISCPVCQFENPSEVDACVRCGKRFTPSETPDTVYDPPEVTIGSPDDPGSSVTSSTPLPAPMIEPIAQTVSPQIPTPPASVLRKGLPDDSGSLTAAITARAPVAAALVEIVAADPRLVVVRGERLNVAFPILDGKNYIGRSAENPVDIDLDGQEAIERIWTSRQHAVVTWDRGELVLEDLNSLNGTFVNRNRIHPGQQRLLKADDIVQIGTVQLKVVV